MTMADGGARLRESLLKATLLKRAGKDPLLPQQVQMAMVGKVLVVYFAFPRSEGIVLEDKDVEFISKTGPLEIKKKFKLADMVIDGKLTL